MISIHSWFMTKHSLVSIEPMDMAALARAWLHYVTGSAIYEAFAFHWLHKAMHSRRLYFIHKIHHTPGKDCNAFGAVYFDPLDLVVSFAHGTFCVWLFGTGGVHFFTLLLTMIAGNNVHSCNPYSLVLFLPPLDFCIKPNIRHQLHHGVNRGYWDNLPLHHLVPSRLREDLDKYNRVLTTSVDIYYAAPPSRRLSRFHSGTMKGLSFRRAEGSNVAHDGEGEQLITSEPVGASGESVKTLDTEEELNVIGHEYRMAKLERRVLFAGDRVLFDSHEDGYLSGRVLAAGPRRLFTAASGDIIRVALDGEHGELSITRQKLLLAPPPTSMREGDRIRVPVAQHDLINHDGMVWRHGTIDEVQPAGELITVLFDDGERSPIMPTYDVQLVAVRPGGRLGHGPGKAKTFAGWGTALAAQGPASRVAQR